MTTATQQGAANNDSPTSEQQVEQAGADWDEFDAGEELLERFLRTEKKDAPKKEPSRGSEETERRPAVEADDADKSAARPDETDDDEDDSDDQDDTTSSDKKKTFAEEEGTFVKIKVGDDEHEVPVAKLTRLYGQEAALTKKSMEVAEARKVADAGMAKNTAATTALLAQARSRYEPYSKLDFNLLASQLDPQEYTALRDSARQAYEEVQFLEQHLDGFMQAIMEREHSGRRDKAISALKTLTGPVENGGIEGFSQKVYDDIRSFALSYGIPEDAINNAIDPWAIRLMHDAMLYARGKQKAVVKTTKVNKGPKRITKTTNSPVSERSGEGNTPDRSKAIKRLQRSGSEEDAAAALLAGWRRDE
jgi:hypothetical protein